MTLKSRSSRSSTLASGLRSPQRPASESEWLDGVLCSWKMLGEAKGVRVGEGGGAGERGSDGKGEMDRGSELLFVCVCVCACA